MIKWCAYCQKFLGEDPPLENKTFSHGICASCAKKGLLFSDEKDHRIDRLVELNKQFWYAGRSGSPSEMERLAHEGIAAGVRPIDILYGIAAPHLSTIGSLWEKNEITVCDEHLFTSMCEVLLDVISKIIVNEFPPSRHAPKVLLMNAPENHHSLGNRFASIGLVTHGYNPEILPDNSSVQEIAHKIGNEKYELIGFSMSMPSQSASLKRTITELLKETEFSNPIIIGGAAIKSGFQLQSLPENVIAVERISFDSADSQIWLNLTGSKRTTEGNRVDS